MAGRQQPQGHREPDVGHEVPWQSAMNEDILTPPTERDRSSVDELIAAALAYHSPERLRALLAFTAKLRRYSPYNAMLLHIQNPELKMVATPRDWQNRYERKVLPGARPLVILAPMHPVMFVFDVKDTDGPALPEAVQMELKDVFQADGHVPDKHWVKTLRSCQKLKITVGEEHLDEGKAGHIKRVNVGFALALNQKHNRNQQYATLVHELGHLFLGHLGTAPLGWWKPRMDLRLDSRELEAEIVSYLVCSRLRLALGSDKYLAGYLDGGELPPFSLDNALIAAGKIEEMGRGTLRLKKEGSK